MLSAFRKSAKSKFAVVIYALIALSFVVWGIDVTAFNVTSGSYPVEAGDERVTVAQLDRAFQRDISQIRQNLGANFTTEQALQFGMMETTLQRLVGQAVLNEAARDMGVGVSEQAVRRAIVSDPSFRNDLGQFDRSAFTQILAMNRYSEAAYVQEVERELLRAQLIDSLAAGIAAPAPLLGPISDFRAERRRGSYFVVKSESLADPATPDSDTLMGYYTDNPGPFTAPEYRDITVVTLTADVLAPSVVVAENDALEAYEQEQARFLTPETRTLRQMLFPADQAEKATAALARLNAGEDFALVAGQEAGMTGAMTELGTLNAAQTMDIIRDDVFSAPEGGVVGPIKSDFGWHLVRVDAVSPEVMQPFDAVREQLISELQLARAAEDLFELSGNFEDTLGAGAGFEQAADQFGMPLTTATVDRNGTGQDGDPVTFPAPEILVQAFELEDGEEGQLTQYGEGDYFIVRVNRVIPSAPRPFGTLRDEVEAAWRRDEKARQARETAEDLAGNVTGGDLAPLAAAGGYTLHRLDPTNRTGDGADNAVPAAVISSLFASEQNRAEAVGVSGGYAVVVLEEVIPTTGSSDEKARLAEQIRRELADEMVTSFSTALATEIDVRINRTLISQMYTQSPQRLP